jgi:hypothetical protein
MAQCHQLCCSYLLMYVLICLWCCICGKTRNYTFPHFVFVFCVCVYDFRTFVYSPGQMPIRTMVSGFFAIVDGPYRNVKLEFYCHRVSNCLVRLLHSNNYTVVCNSMLFLVFYLHCFLFLT